MVMAGKADMPEDVEKLSGFEGPPDTSGVHAETLADDSVKGHANKKKKGIVGFVGMEVHD
jgi:hypothetical protein